MIRVTAGNNMNKITEIVNENEMTARELLEKADVDTSRCMVSTNRGTILSGDKLDKPLAEVGVQDGDRIMAVLKIDNAA